MLSVGAKDLVQRSPLDNYNDNCSVTLLQRIRTQDYFLSPQTQKIVEAALENLRNTILPPRVLHRVCQAPQLLVKDDSFDPKLTNAKVASDESQLLPSEKSDKLVETLLTAYKDILRIIPLELMRAWAASDYQFETIFAKPCQVLDELTQDFVSTYIEQYKIPEKYQELLRAKIQDTISKCLQRVTPNSFYIPEINKQNLRYKEPSTCSTTLRIERQVIKGDSGAVYAVVEKLGEGSFGEVYKVQDLNTKSFYACKVFQSSNSTHTIGSAEQEFASLERLEKAFQNRDVTKIRRFPKPIELMSVSSSENSDEIQPALIMSLAAGKTLGASIFNQLTKPLEQIKLSLAMAKALHEIHKVGFAHCDVKPANCVLDEKSEACTWIDCASARSNASQILTKTLFQEEDLLKGEFWLSDSVYSDGYRSPEIAGLAVQSIKELESYVDLQRADCYAFGVCMLAILFQKYSEGDDDVAPEILKAYNSARQQSNDSYPSIKLCWGDQGSYFSILKGTVSLPSNSLLHIALKLMDAEPEKRMTMSEAIEALTSLVEAI